MLELSKRLAIVIIAASFAVAACDSSDDDTDEAQGQAPIEQSEDDDGDETDDDATETDEQAAEDDDPLAPPDDVAEPPEDAEVTDSGLAYRVLEEGDGDEQPDHTDSVTVHYTGWQTDGNRFDSSIERGEPTTFPLQGVIPGWTEGVQLMVEGQKNRFWIPEELAYDGQEGPPEGMLVFDIELLEIQ